MSCIRLRRNTGTWQKRKTRLEEQQSTMQSSQMMLHSQTQQLQVTVVEFETHRWDITAAISLTTNVIDCLFFSREK